MIFEVFLGVLAGFAVGLIPGFHVNNVLSFLKSDLVIVSASIAFVFASLISSAFLGSGENFVVLPPVQRILLKRKGILVLSKTINTLMFSAFLLPFFFYLFFLILGVFSFFKKLFFFFLFGALIGFLKHGLKALVVILLSSGLGLICLNKDLLFPLLAGFFASPTLLASIFMVRSFPKQVEVFSKEVCYRHSFLAGFLSLFFSLIPAVSSSIVAVIAKSFFGLEEDDFIIFTGAVSYYYMVFSFAAYSFFGITRSGSAAYLTSKPGLLSLLGLLIFTTIVSGYLALFFLKKAFTVLYFFGRKLFSFVFLLLLFLVFFHHGFFGLLVFFTSTCIGLLCQELEVPRHVCMASLIVPTMLLIY